MLGQDNLVQEGLLFLDLLAENAEVFAAERKEDIELELYELVVLALDGLLAVVGLLAVDETVLLLDLLLHRVLHLRLLVDSPDPLAHSFLLVKEPSFALLQGLQMFLACRTIGLAGFFAQEIFVIELLAFVLPCGVFGLSGGS